MNKNDLIQKYEDAAYHMYGSMVYDNLSVEDLSEWFGYIRGVRDCAHDAGILQETKIQNYLEKAGELYRNKLKKQDNFLEDKMKQFEKDYYDSEGNFCIEDAWSLKQFVREAISEAIYEK